MRSNFEPGTTRWAVRRSQWTALGISEQDMDRPTIAVINSSSGLSSCYAHLDEVSAAVQRAVYDAGGLPFEVRTIAPSDFVTSAGREARYLMPSRDLLVNDIEAMVEGAVLDGMICLSSCDKTTPAHLMAAARLDLPSLVLVCGYQPSGRCGGRDVDIDDVYESVGATAAGTLSLDDLTEMTAAAIQGPGVCAGLGTANSMHIVAEALGMALPGGAPILAASPELNSYAEMAGRRIVTLVEEGITARAIITDAAITNAITVVEAVGGSINTVRHLAAIAAEAELGIDVVAEFERLHHSTPLLARIRPNGSNRVPDLQAAGGARAVMTQLGDLLDGDARSVAGGSISDHLHDSHIADAAIVRTRDQAYSPHGGLAVLRGNLAPEGALLKISAVPAGARAFAGACRVYDSETTAMADIRAGRLAPGQALVLRGMGPKGGPGTVFAAGVVAALVGAGLSADVAVITDGELSGLNSGLTVGQVMPEAAEGGPLAAVRDGDTVSIDLDTLTLTLHIEPDELARRLAQTAANPQPPAPRGLLSQYRQLVSPISRGAVLVDPPPQPGPR